MQIEQCIANEAHLWSQSCELMQIKQLRGSTTLQWRSWAGNRSAKENDYVGSPVGLRPAGKPNAVCCRHSFLAIAATRNGNESSGQPRYIPGDTRGGGCGCISGPPKAGKCLQIHLPWSPEQVLNRDQSREPILPNP